MRAVCTRSGRRGWGVYAHTRGLCRSEGVELSLLFSPRNDGKNTSWREEALLFRREDPFRPSANPSFVSFRLPFFFFFSNRPPSFLDRASPPERGGNHGGEKPQLLCRDSQPDSLLFLVIILCAVLLSFVAIALATRQINRNLSPIRVYSCDLNFSFGDFWTE